jgi:hypothetical protein
MRNSGSQFGSLELWFFHLSSVLPKSFFDQLSPEERARMERITHSEERRRFLAGRGLIRLVLGHYEPGENLRLVLGPEGKPFLNNAQVVKDFSLSHSQDAVVLAVSTAGRVGLDVEFLSPSLEENRRPGVSSALELEAWVRTESRGKFAGTGIIAPAGIPASASTESFTFFLGNQAYALAITHEEKPQLPQVLKLRSASSPLEQGSILPEAVALT